MKSDGFCLGIEKRIKKVPVTLALLFVMAHNKHISRAETEKQMRNQPMFRITVKLLKRDMMMVGLSDDVEMIDKAAAAATAAYNTPDCPWQELSDIQVEMEFEAMQFIRELCPSY